MSNPNWCDILGWKAEHLQELRIAGYTYLKEGKYETAKIFFEALVIIDPTNAYDCRTLGALYLLMGNLVGAIEILNKALELDPSHLGARLNRTKALLFLGNLREGLEEARNLMTCSDTTIADDAEALIMAYNQ
jgi:tetratricopeptide (TPR) repeat protein